jgi:hypothetical protein
MYAGVRHRRAPARRNIDEHYILTPYYHLSAIRLNFRAPAVNTAAQTVLYPLGIADKPG